jgi:hypothetical protein
VLFKERHVGPIERGEKTVTRRLWKRWHVRVGGIYPIQTRLFGPGSEPRGWVRVTDGGLERLGDITEASALAEGGYTTEEFRRVWTEINGAWDPTRVVHVVEFEYVGRERPDGNP